VVHERGNDKFIRKSYLESEKYSQLEGTGQNRREKIQILLYKYSVGI